MTNEKRTYPRDPAAAGPTGCGATSSGATAGPGNPGASRNPAAPSHGQRIALYGLLVCVALVAGYVEALIPLPVTVPGVKLGLGNVVVLFALRRLGTRPAFFLMLAKVLCTGLLFANPSMMLYSLAGGLLSWALTALAEKSGWFSLVATSVVGGVAHNAGQLALVAALFSPAVALVNVPVLAVSGVVAGLAVGVLATLALRTVPNGGDHAR